MAVSRLNAPSLPIDGQPCGPCLLLARGVVDSIAKLLPKRVGFRYHENILYIAGHINEDVRTGVMCIVPKAETGPGYYKTDRASHLQVLRALGEAGLVVVAQVHCHPSNYVSHSFIDDEYAFMKGEGFWSIVVPHYGRRGMLPLAACGVHCFRNGAFQLLSAEAVEARLRVLPPFVDLRACRR